MRCEVVAVEAAEEDGQAAEGQRLQSLVQC